MTFYLTDRGESYAVCREAEAAVGGKWLLRFRCGAGAGMLYANGRPYVMREETVLLPDEALREGENTLVCVTAGVRYPIEPLCRAGRVIFPKAPDTAQLYLRLAEQLEHIADVAEAAEKRLSALEKQANGYPLLP